MASEYLTLALLWLLWGCLHSGLISLSFTGWLRERLGTAYRGYRLFFTFFSLLSLSVVLLYSRSLEGEILFAYRGGWEVLRLALASLALLLLAAGALKYDLLTFLGLRQLFSGETPRTLSGGRDRLDTSGVLGLIRHPWYLAALLLLWSHRREFDAAACITSAVLSAYLVAGTLLEERKLRQELGDEYRHYMQEVSMLLPLKWLIRKLAGKGRAG